MDVYHRNITHTHIHSFIDTHFMYMILLKKYKRIADAKEYRETHPKQNLSACA